MTESCCSLKSMRLVIQSADGAGTEYFRSNSHEYELYLADDVAESATSRASNSVRDETLKARTSIEKTPPDLKRRRNISHQLGRFAASRAQRVF